KPGYVEGNAAEEDDGEGRVGELGAEQAAGVQGAHDGQVARESHEHRQPGARHDERVYYAHSVHGVDEVEGHRARVCCAKVDEGVWQEDEAEAEVGEGESHHAAVRRTLQALHGGLEAAVRQGQEIERVAQQSEYAHCPYDLRVEHLLHPLSQYAGSSSVV